MLDAYPTLDHPGSHSIARPSSFFRVSLHAPIRFLCSISSIRASSLPPPRSLPIHPFARTATLFPPESVLSNASHLLVLCLYSFDSTISPVLISRFSICHSMRICSLSPQLPLALQFSFCFVHNSFSISLAHRHIPRSTLFPYVLFIPTNYEKNKQTRQSAGEEIELMRNNRAKKFKRIGGGDTEKSRNKRAKELGLI